MSNNRLVAKYQRLKLSEELRSMVGELPVHGLEERQFGGNVYLGQGTIRTGCGEAPVLVRVWMDGDGDLFAGFRSDKAGIELREPFNTAEERTAFPKKVQATVKKTFN